MEKLNGYTYTVTAEQVEQHKKRSFEEIMLWLQSTNTFLNTFQTSEEKALMKKIRKGN